MESAISRKDEITQGALYSFRKRHAGCETYCGCQSNQPSQSCCVGWPPNQIMWRYKLDHVQQKPCSKLKTPRSERLGTRPFLKFIQNPGGGNQKECTSCHVHAVFIIVLSWQGSLSDPGPSTPDTWVASSSHCVIFMGTPNQKAWISPTDPRPPSPPYPHPGLPHLTPNPSPSRDSEAPHPGPSPLHHHLCAESACLPCWTKPFFLGAVNGDWNDEQNHLISEWMKWKMKNCHTKTVNYDSCEVYQWLTWNVQKSARCFRGRFAAWRRDVTSGTFNESGAH